MKKLSYFFSVVALALFVGIAAGSDEPRPGEDPVIPEDPAEIVDLLSQYFSIESATYVQSAFPEGTPGVILKGFSINTQCLAGGMNFINVRTSDIYTKFYVSIKDVPAYLEVVPTSEETETGYRTYTVPVVYSPLLDRDITMVISAEDANGVITEPIYVTIHFVTSMTGDLDIKLTFSNAKDVDLHLYMPDGQHIYYGNRGGYITLEDGTEVTYGLDHDSNAGCSIDNLNNENIYIPAELIQNGTYRVEVNMWSNCDPSVATNWSVVARYKGVPVQNLLGTGNPVSGVYPVGAGSGDHSIVMEFTIDDAPVSRAAAVKSVRLIPRSDLDEIKMMDEKDLNILNEMRTF